MTIRPRVLLTGANGQVGFEIWQALAPIADVVAFSGLNARPAAVPCTGLDLSQLELLDKTIREVNPQLIINAAAYTAVDKAESQQSEAFRINADALAVIGAAALRIGAAVLHFSTDYVYPGHGTAAYDEADPTDPINVYGQSKLQGELKLIGSGATYLILRTSWVYGIYGQNFVKTMLRLGQERSELKVVDDQFGAPTSARTLANFTCHLVQRSRSRDLMRSIAAIQGIYHLTDSGCTNWFGFAEEIFRLAHYFEMELKLENLLACKGVDFPTAAKRPQNSRLALNKLKDAFDFQPPPWQASLGAVLAPLAGC